MINKLPDEGLVFTAGAKSLLTAGSAYLWTSGELIYRGHIEFVWLIKLQQLVSIKPDSMTADSTNIQFDIPGKYLR